MRQGIFLYTSFVPQFVFYGQGKVQTEDQFRILGNCQPTPPLTQHFALSEKCYCWLRGGVGGQFPRNLNWSQTDHFMSKIERFVCRRKSNLSHIILIRSLWPFSCNGRPIQPPLLTPPRWGSFSGMTSAPQRQKFHTDDVKSVRNLVRSSDWST